MKRRGCLPIAVALVTLLAWLALTTTDRRPAPAPTPVQEPPAAVATLISSVTIGTTSIAPARTCSRCARVLPPSRGGVLVYATVETGEPLVETVLESGLILQRGGPTFREAFDGCHDCLVELLDDYARLTSQVAVHSGAKTPRR